MVFDPIRAETRFGYGLSPLIAPPQGVQEMIAGVRAPDEMATRFPISHFMDFSPRISERKRIRKIVLGSVTKARKKAALEEMKALRADTRGLYLDWMRQTLQRQLHTDQGFRERLVAFWADHFTARGKQQIIERATSAYVEDAVRPNIAGRFEDMLIAVETHPLMLHFLDQDKSIGPNSKIALKKTQKRGLNENLAREIMELHTLGVDGPYTQDDVRQLAELLTGLSWDERHGGKFRPAIVEPGKETVLGKSYGPDGGVDDIHAVLRDLANHPATAHHLAWKLAVHFVADKPDPDLVGDMARAYLDASGDLVAMYETLLRHPSSWRATPGNVKRPQEFMASSLRALGLSEKELGAWPEGKIGRWLWQPVRLMGQSWQAPAGPDGWAEEDDQWLTPQGMAGRMQWALSLPEVLGREVPDPRDFVKIALGPEAPGQVVFAAKAAENRREGVALVLMSPAFQRH